MKFLSIVILTLMSTSAFAQFKLTGMVRNSNNALIDGASVLLFKERDSILFKSAITRDQGRFEFNEIEPGDYSLQISFTGFDEIDKKLTVTDKNIILDSFVLMPRAKVEKEVIVVAKKPFLEQRGEKLVVNIENSATTAGATALEILRKVPGLIVRDGSITMSGKSSVSIYINGRASQYTDMAQFLADMPGDNIEKIEVIANPGAKYDASGGAVINIVLKKNSNLGTNGYVKLMGGLGIYSQSKNNVDGNFGRFVPSFIINHRKGKINWYADYSYNFNEDFDNDIFVRQIDTNTITQHSFIPIQYFRHSYRTGLDIYVNKNNIIGILYQGFNNIQKTEGVVNSSNMIVSGSGTTIDTFETKTKQRITNVSNAINFNWKHKFDSTGKEINFDLDYYNYQIKSNGTITNLKKDIVQSSNSQKVNNPVQFAVFKTDYSMPVKKGMNLEAGLKISYALIDNDLYSLRPLPGSTVNEINFRYTENINAAYINFKKTADSWGITGGLRVEQTIAKGRNKNSPLFNRNYVQLFPSVLVTKKITDKFSVMGQYTARIDRPSFQQQNPFIRFIDSLTYTRGNPLLLPQRTNQGEFSVLYKNQPFLSISYSNTRDVIFENAPKQDSLFLFTQPENLARAEKVNFQINLPIPLGDKFDGYIANIISHNQYSARYLNLDYKLGKWNYTLAGELTYKASPTFSVSVDGFYTTSQLVEFINLKSFGALNFGASKMLWNKKARIGFSFGDMFYSMREAGSISFEKISAKVNQRENTRNARLSFTYYFGNRKLKESRTRESASEKETERVKTN
ncbi:MAG: TonB-dependent receptor [Ferruginibacter sp.]|nr:TonB-dependent receptor [Ferruginibacter sp.]